MSPPLPQTAGFSDESIFLLLLHTHTHTHTHTHKRHEQFSVDRENSEQPKETQGSLIFYKRSSWCGWTCHQVTHQAESEGFFFLWSVQFSSIAQSSPTLCNPMDSSTPGSPFYHQLPELTQTHVHWVGDAIQLILYLPLLLLPSVFPSIRVFSNESVFLIRWPKYWSFNFSISPSNE